MLRNHHQRWQLFSTSVLRDVRLKQRLNATNADNCLRKVIQRCVLLKRDSVVELEEEPKIRAITFIVMLDQRASHSYKMSFWRNKIKRVRAAVRRRVKMYRNFFPVRKLQLAPLSKTDSITTSHVTRHSVSMIFRKSKPR